MNILFMGTPDFAVPSLRALINAGYSICAVVTQPDRPKGRKRELMPSPVKQEALKHGIVVLQPEKLRETSAAEMVAANKPDLIVTAAYGQILPRTILDLPKHGCLNIHGSLLPQYRGGAPIQRAIMNGEHKTGVTLMYMAEGLDTGDMISRIEIPIEDDDTAGSIFDKLSYAGAQLLISTLPDLLSGKMAAVPQNHDEATYAPNLSRADEWIDWSKSALAIRNQVRGLNPWPGAFTLWNGDVFKIWKCELGRAASGSNGAPSTERAGTVVEVSDSGIRVVAGSGSVILREIQPAGKKAMDAGQFIRGAKLSEGTLFGRDAT